MVILTENVHYTDKETSYVNSSTALDAENPISFPDANVNSIS